MSLEEMINNQDNHLVPFLSTPHVVRLKILSHLTLEEQLLLRQVCKTTGEWIDSSSVPYHTPVTIINDHGVNSFKKFLERKPLHIIKSLYIKNNSEHLFQDPAMPFFMRKYSSNITSLRIQQFFPCKSASDVAFFEGFTNLSELQLDKVSIPSDREAVCLFPIVFNNLKTLKIGSVKAYPEPPDSPFGSTLIPLRLQRSIGQYIWELIRFCENVEFLGYPSTSKYFFQAFVDGRGRGEFGAFLDYIRARQLTPGPQLKFCDFQNDNWDPDTKNALPMLKLGSELGIKFLNLNANLFQYIKIDSLITMYDLPSNAGDCILSFKHFNCLISKCLPSVRRISLSASEVNTGLDYSCIFNGPKTFPNLEDIEIIIDVGFSLPETDIYHRAREFRGVKTLLSHFFYDMEMILFVDQDEEMKHVRHYEKVHSLAIRFVDLPSKTMRKANPEDLPLKWIVESLPSLRKLTLQGWNSHQNSICNDIVKNFPKLEELILDGCENIEELCFNARNCTDLVRITIRSEQDKIGFTESDLDNFIGNCGFHPSVFLNKSSHHQQITWCKCPGES